jgi:hypothetical protein
MATTSRNPNNPTKPEKISIVKYSTTLLVVGKTFRHRFVFGTLLGGKFVKEKDYIGWEFPLDKEELVREHVEDILETEGARRKEAAQRANKTKSEKRLTRENHSVIKEKIQEIRKVLKNPMVDIPQNGYCYRCKKQAILDLDPSCYADLSSCPKCRRTWDD